MRRTNLFYPLYIVEDKFESRFVTFSNYTEAMTGNHLSVDTKMFPSKFICLNINKTKIEDLYEELMSYYENKLAFLRDKIGIDDNLKVEEAIQPLNYLLETILKATGETTLPITYIGEISEQNYNGTYTDTICIIEGNALPIKASYINKEAGSIIKTCEYTYKTDYLYGWHDNAETPIWKGPSCYEDVNPVLDGTSIYNINSTHSGIKTEPSEGVNSIEFNCIIPLFDIVNVNYLNNRSEIIDQEHIELTFENPEGALINQPMGMWFTANGDPIALKRDTDTGYMPSWSLVIGSQFKPMPNSTTYTTQDKNDTAVEVNTFAEILAKQNEITNTFNHIISQFEAMSNEIAILKSQIPTLGMIDDLRTSLDKFRATTETEINTIKENIKENIWYTNK